MVQLEQVGGEKGQGQGLEGLGFYMAACCQNDNQQVTQSQLHLLKLHLSP